MKQWIKWSIVVIVVGLSALVIADKLLERSARRAATDNGAFRDFHDITATQLEQQVRSSVPIGSSRTTVENYVKNRGMQFSFNSSENEIDAIARYLKDSSFVVRSDLGLRFRFDRNEKLQSIQTKIELTGP